MGKKGDRGLELESWQKLEIEGGFIFEELGNRGREGTAEEGKIGKDKESEE